MKYRILLLPAIFVLAAVAGCVRTVETVPFQAGIGELPEYPELARYRLKLEMIGARDFTAGSAGTVTFSLTNIDTHPVRIAEWFLEEQNNLIIHCQPWLPGMEEAIPEAWATIVPDTAKAPVRYPLSLGPEKSMLVAAPLDFIRHLTVSPDGERRYFIYAELNLHSVKAVSPVAAIAVRAPQP